MFNCGSVVDVRSKFDFLNFSPFRQLRAVDANCRYCVTVSFRIGEGNLGLLNQCLVFCVCTVYFTETN